MVGILVLARLGSKRLPQKHLQEAAGRPFIWWLLQRFIHEFSDEIGNGAVKILIATSDETQNLTFDGIVKDLNAAVFYGNLSNVPMRELECAKHYGFSEIISVDGDDILCSTKAARRVLDELGLSTRIEMVVTKGLPLGMNVMGFKTKFLERSLLANHSQVLETGWGRIFEPSKIIELNLGNFDRDFSLRFTLDYPLDAEFFRKVIEHVGETLFEITDEQLVKLVIENKYNSINCSLSEEYWRNFNDEKQKEIKDGN
jgi:spore coat polysaccharide biosynthesis protein SpsF (cytidylyltransferase family)